MKFLKASIISLFLLTTLFTSNVFANYLTGGGYIDYTQRNWSEVYANIKTPTYPNTYFQSLSTAWDMLMGLGNHEWAQVGWIKTNRTEKIGTYYVFQYNDDYLSRPYTIYGTYGPAQNSTHSYKTTYNGSGYTGIVDGSYMVSPLT